MSRTKRWWIVFVYAVAMAWVEAAAVLYLRTLVNRIEPYQTRPLPVSAGFGFAEMTRELATLVMLAAVGILAGKMWRARLGYAAMAFGLWDIFYYVFLKVLCGWPHSLLDWDVLFLVPLPWWGPVLAPVLIAMLMVVWGTIAASWEKPADFSELKGWLLSVAGALIALYVFMADCLRVAGQGEDALRDVLPVHFNWPLFSVALALMASPVIQLLWNLRGPRKPDSRSFGTAQGPVNVQETAGS